EDNANFQRLLQRVLAVSTSERDGLAPEAMSVRRTGQQAPLWIVVRPISAAMDGFEQFHVAVQLSVENDGEDDGEIPIEALQHLLGLTRSEATVALQL